MDNKEETHLGFLIAKYSYEPREAIGGVQLGGGQRASPQPDREILPEAFRRHLHRGLRTLQPRHQNKLAMNPISMSDAWLAVAVVTGHHSAHPNAEKKLDDSAL